MHVQGDELIADFTGSSPQAKGPINATLGVTWGATYNAVFVEGDAGFREAVLQRFEPGSALEFTLELDVEPTP